MRLLKSALVAVGFMLAGPLWAHGGDRHGHGHHHGWHEHRHSSEWRHHRHRHHQRHHWRQHAQRHHYYPQYYYPPYGHTLSAPGVHIVIPVR